MPFSSSSELANAFEDAFSCCAMDKREEVRDSCSVRLCVRSASVVAVLIPVLSPPDRAKSSARGFRDRRVEDPTTPSSFWVSWASLSDSKSDGSLTFSDWVDCASEDAVGGGVRSLWLWSSVDVSPGVSSPNKSSPSEVSASESKYSFN
jgi:hypothetical protein